MGAPQHPHQFGPEVNADNIPQSIRGGAWCVWTAVPKQKDPTKFDKIPNNGFMQLSPYDLASWLTFEQALAVYRQSPDRFNGIGKQILPTDNITVIDIDGVDPAFIQKWTETWPTYWERSPSGAGLRGVSLGRSARDMSKPIELYAGYNARFVTFTGDVVLNNMPLDLTQYINSFIQQHAGTNTMLSEIPDMPEPEDRDSVLQRYQPIQYPVGTDRSEFNFSIAFKMLINGSTPQDVFSLFMASDEVWQMACEHRRRSDDVIQYQAAAEYLWRDVCKAEAAAIEERDKHLTVFQDLSPPTTPQVEQTTPSSAPVQPQQDVTGWLDQFKPSYETMDAIGQEVYLYPDLIIQSHLIIMPAPPESGKTTIAMMLARYMAQQGYKVRYVNADCPAPHAKEYFYRAEAEGFSMLLPDFVDGGSMARVVEGLRWTAGQTADLSNEVFIFDTMKKMTDVISKREAKDLLVTLRALTAKGATVVCLAHTNKYRVDGEHMFEGTGDIKSDCDDLIYLEALPDDSHGRRNRTITVSTRLDKFRGVADQISFHIDKDRVVTQLREYVDVSSQVEANMNRGQDDFVIEAIQAELSQIDTLVQQDLITRVQPNAGCGRDRLVGVLNRYAGMMWYRQRQAEHHNRIVYSATPFEEVES